MGNKKLNLKYIKKVEKLDSDVENLESSFSGFIKRFDTTITDLFKKIDAHQRDTSPKPVSYGMILSGGVAIVTMLGAMFAIMIYISNSSNSPILAQQAQILNTMNSIVSNQTKLSSNIQLANKDISVIKNKSKSNEDSLHYILYEKELFPTLAEMQKDIEFIKKGVK